MSKIDTTQWKEFEIGKLFYKVELKAKKQFNKATDVSLVKTEEFSLPLVNAKDGNNGIMYYGRESDFEFEEMCLDIVSDGAVSTGNVYAQPQKTGILYNAYLIKSYLPSVSEKSLLFLATIIQKTIKQKYGYENKAGWQKVKEEKIKLPVDINGNPNFAYMEQYMQNLESAVSSSLTALRSAKSSKTCEKLDVASWEDFHLYDIFNIDSGTKLDKAKMDTTSDEICFVGRSGVNNGITQKVKRIEGVTPYNAGNLTLSLGGAYLGSCFVQEEPFYTSQNVVVLIPKQNIGFYAKQFIATAIFKESQNNYKAFIKELNAFIKTTFSIKLPVKENGEIDYDFMGEFILNKYMQAKNSLNYLMAI